MYQNPSSADVSNVYSLPQSVSQTANTAVAPNPVPSQPQVVPVGGNAVQQPVKPVNTVGAFGECQACTVLPVGGGAAGAREGDQLGDDGHSGVDPIAAGVRDEWS